MRITLLRNTLDRDSLNPPDADHAEIVFWKRVKGEGVAEVGDSKTPFIILLDVRARLLQVIKDGAQGAGAEAIATALVNQMSSYTLVPRSRLFSAKRADKKSAEWIVRDAEHVSGLLHRIREGKAFDVAASPPEPPGLQPVREKLLAAVDENLTALHAWNKFQQRPGQQDFLLPFDLFTWQILQPRFLELSDDIEVQLNLARFFDNVRQFGDGSKMPRGPRIERSGVGVSTPVEATLNILFEPTTQLGYKLLMDHGKTYSLPRHLSLN